MDSPVVVTLDELKKHLRIYNAEMDDSLTMMLHAAINAIENFTLINFKADFEKNENEVPYALKAAILLTAGRLFENPTDSVDTLPTVSKNLANPFRRWDRIRQKSTPENS